MKESGSSWDLESEGSLGIIYCNSKIFHLGIRHPKVMVLPAGLSCRIQAPSPVLLEQQHAQVAPVPPLAALDGHLTHNLES